MFLRCLMTACCPKHVCGVFKVLQPIKIKALLPFFFFFSNRWVPGFIFFFFFFCHFHATFFFSKAFVFENSNPIDAIPQKQYCRRGSIAAPHSPCRRSVVTSRELDANRGALMSNKTAKPGWYWAYCESHPQTDLSECLSACPSLSASASESQTFRKVSYEIIMK